MNFSIVTLGWRKNYNNNRGAEIVGEFQPSLKNIECGANYCWI